MFRMTKYVAILISSTANSLLQSIDETVNPCDNFYQFACGTWIKNARIPDDDSVISALSGANKQLNDLLMDFLSLSSTNETNELNSIINARRLYKSCVNQETIEADSVDFLLSLINNEFGGWPILQGPIWNNSTFNLSNLLLKMAEYNLNSIYVVMTTVDDKNSSMHAIGVGQGTLGLGERQLYESESALTNSYRQWIQDLALILTNVTSMIDNDVTSIFEFEKKIAEYSLTTAEQIAHQKDNIRTTIDFSNYIRRVYELVNVTLNDTDLVIVGEIEYLRNVSKLITQYSSRTVRNYFIWSFMMKIIDYMPKRYRATKQQFTQILEGAVAEVPRSLTCSSNVNSLMGFALSRLYVPKYFDEKARNEYKFNSSYIRNGLTIAKLTARSNFRLVRQFVDRQVWVMPPTRLEAAYNPFYNSILVPAAILQAPTFDKDLPKYLNYGGIGTIIGHEITHGFDTIGRQFDRNGNQVSWWTNQTIAAFDKQNECFIQQYSNYTVLSLNRQVDGALTISENLADNGGLKEAFFAYRKWAQENPNADKKLPGLNKYSREQLLFINYGQIWCAKIRDSFMSNFILADVHSPPQFRVIGSTSNFVEFDRAFGCKPGQLNSRVNKCILCTIILRMAVVIDVPSESLNSENKTSKNSRIAQLSINKKSHIREHPIMKEFVTSGLSVSVANVVTLPIDVLKVRLQLANAAMTTSKSSMKAGLIETTRLIYRKEGIRAFYSGLMPAIVRGLFYGGVRLGAYGPIKNMLKHLVTDDKQASIKFLRDISAACLSGSTAAIVSNPVDLCKTKLQTKNSKYTSSFHVIRDVIQQYGIKGLWVGTVPAAFRTAALTATQCVTYDHAKRFWIQITGWGEGIKLHLGASLITGLITTTVTAPLDTIKTNMYAAGSYGVTELTNKIVNKEGFRGLLRGWTAAYVRLGPQTVVIFLVMERLRQFSAKTNDFNPYEVLGLTRTASDKEIRQAYKKLARYWHPDKNSEPNAHEQFTKINAAYEILSDSIKRQNYDDYGTTSQDNHRGFNTNHFRDPYDIFRAHFGSDFNFFHESPSGAKKIIHSREFLHNILPNSDKKPYVLFGSTNFCLHCREPLIIFRSLEKQFNDVGIGTAEFNTNDQRLSNELGILNAPSLCVISQRRVYHFNDHGKSNQYTETNIKEFVRKSIPIQRYIKTVRTSNDLLSLISSYNETNRVHAILITKQKTPTLKFVIPCLQHLTRIQCAVLNSSMTMTSEIPSFLKQVSTITDTVLLFKEDKNPIAVLKDNDLTFVNIQKLFESNQLLHLPTITSSNVFNLVCQTNSAKPCFLIIGNAFLFEQYRSSFLFLAKQLFEQYGSRMAYLDSSSTKQISFSQIFSSIYHPNDKKLVIVVIRRWFDDSIELVNTEVEFDGNSLNEFKRNNLNMVADIEANLKLYLTIRWQNAKKFTLPTIFDFDERNENIFTIIINQIQDKWNYWFERNPIFRSLSGYAFTYQFCLFFLSIIFYLWYTKQDSDSNLNNHIKQTRRSYPSSTTTNKKSNELYREPNNTIKLHEFNESFLQSYTNPNASNVIILLLIANTPDDSCIAHFTRQISSINDSRMIFTILYRKYSPRWLNELYANIEDDQNRHLVRFITSTVLALYIRRKFFVPYGPLSNKNDNDEILDENGAFIGMDNYHERSSSISSIESTASTTDSLSFSDWIDLLFDGNIRTPISITEWPMIFR
ncbi:unnamed protein product [Rotaria sp. Silwood1]|nr:unnamed protein product [Rotaria sp. Silwood1]